MNILNNLNAQLYKDFNQYYVFVIYADKTESIKDLLPSEETIFNYINKEIKDLVRTDNYSSDKSLLLEFHNNIYEKYP